MLDLTVLKQAVEAKAIPALKTDRQISQVRFSPCGKFLLAAGHDALVHRWDMTGEQPLPLKPMAGHQGWVQSVICRAAGELMLTADSWGQLRCGRFLGEDPAAVWTVPQAHDGWITGLALSPDGETVVTVGIDRTVRGWSVTNGEKRFEWTPHRTEVFSVAFAIDGQSVFTGDLDGRVIQTAWADGKTVREFDASALHVVNRLQDVGGARLLGVSKSGTELLVAGTKPKNGGNVQGVPTVLVFQIADGALTQTIELGKEGDVYVTDLIETGDQQWLATVSGNPGAGKLVAFQITDEKLAFETTKFPNCHSLSLHPDGLRLAVCATNAGSNGNGRPLDKEGKYPGNHSPIHLLRMGTVE